MKAVVGIGMALGFASSLAAQPSAAAEPPAHVSLRWNAPDECPDDARLLQAVEGFLGEALSETPEQQLSVSASVAGVAGGFSAKIRFQGPAGKEERFLDHPDCQKLMEAAALLVALAIDPERVKARQQTAEHSAEPPVVLEPPPVPATPPLTLTPAPERNGPSPSPAPSPARERQGATRPLHVVLGVFGLAGGGVLPSFGPGAGVEVGLRREHFQVGVVGRYWLPRTDPVPGSPNADIELGLATLGARFCGIPWLGALRPSGCVGADVGALSGTGHGLDNPRPRTARFSQLSADLLVAYGSDRLAPFVGFEAAWALEQPQFGVHANGQPVETFRPGAWSLAGLVGLSYAW